MTQVFVSHAEEDRDLAEEVAGALEKCCFGTWYYERDSMPGPPYLDQVCAAIEQCKAFMLLISPDSVKSRQVGAEFIRAYETQKSFVPVLNDINHVEFQKRKPGWRLALGAATSIEIPPTGFTAILDLIKTGLKIMGVKPASEPLRSRNLTCPPRSAPDSSSETVECTLFAPPDISPGASCLVHVWLHTAGQTVDIAHKSTEFDVFMLFWSEAASRSAWIEKEWSKKSIHGAIIKRPHYLDNYRTRITHKTVLVSLNVPDGVFIVFLYVSTSMFLTKRFCQRWINPCPTGLIGKRLLKSFTH